jgi:hypothetical protein
VIELKNPADENATIWTAFNQLQTYKQQIPSLFTFNETLVVSDGLDAQVGSITANQEWFVPWRTIEGEEPVLCPPNSHIPVFNPQFPGQSKKVQPTQDLRGDRPLGIPEHECREELRRYA